MSVHHFRYFVIVLPLTVGLWGAGQAVARFDHNEIRRLYRSGTILSLDAIVAKHRRRYPGGQLLEAELEFEQNRYVYDLKIIDDDGVVREFEYDAASGELWHLEDKK